MKNIHPIVATVLAAASLAAKADVVAEITNKYSGTFVLFDTQADCLDGWHYVKQFKDSSSSYVEGCWRHSTVKWDKGPQGGVEIVMKQMYGFEPKDMKLRHAAWEQMKLKEKEKEKARR